MSCRSFKSSSSERQERPLRMDSYDRSRSRDRYHQKVFRDKDDKRRKRGTVQSNIKLPQPDANLITFRKFMQIQNEDIDPKVAKEHFERYKKGWIRKENQIFFYQHKQDAWFQQKYDPFACDRILKMHEEQTRQNAIALIERLRNKQFDGLDWRITEDQLSLIRHPDQQAQRDQGLSAFQLLLNQNFDVKQGPWYGFDPDHLTIFIKPVPKNISKFDLKEVFEKLPGFESISLSQPLKKQDYVRYCWVSFKDQSYLNKALQNVISVNVKNQSFNLIKSSSNFKKARFVKLYPKERLDIDVAACIKLIRAFDQRYDIKDNPIYNLQLPKTNILDICQLYLRRAYSYDYFSAQRFTDERLLATKCGLIHFRIQISDPDYDIHNFLTKAQKQAQKRAADITNYKPPIAPENHILQSLCKLSSQGVSKQQCQCITCSIKFSDLQDLVQHANQNHLQNKTCRCILCGKRFQQPKYLYKHFETRHKEQQSYRCLCCRSQKSKFSDKQQAFIHVKDTHREQFVRMVQSISLRRYSQDQNKIANNPYVLEHYNSKQQSRLRNNWNKRTVKFGKDRLRQRKRQPYNDLDDPATLGGNQAPAKTRSLINYLEI